VEKMYFGKMDFIKKTSQAFFGTVTGRTVDGITLDDAYDGFKRNRYIDFVKNENINYIWSQDNDMDLLSFFPDIEYLTIPGGAENLKSVQKLRKLKGIELSYNCFSEIDFNDFSEIESLVIHGQINDTNKLAKIKTLKHLYCSQWELKSLETLSVLTNLETLVLDFCKNLIDLNGLSKLKNINRFRIIYCKKLTNISEIKNVGKSLKILDIIDCAQIDNLSYIQNLKNLVSLSILTTNAKKINSFESLKFINDLNNLEEFTTDYKIKDNDLSPLLRLQDAVILNYSKKYNIRDKDLPKKFVNVRTSEYTSEMKLLTEVEGGKENPNIIWYDEI
jgi:hypothetical protein